MTEFEFTKENYQLLLDKINGLQETVDKGFEKMNGRVTTLEQWRWKLIGIVSAIGLLFGGVGAKIMAIFSGSAK